MLAETPSLGLDMGAVIIILLMLVGLVGLVVAGFVCAPRAGRGSRAALVVWIVALVPEILLSLASVAAIARGELDPAVLLFPGMVAAQVHMFVRARADGGGGTAPRG